MTTHWLPRWVIDVATTIHYYEAILACLAIVIWHFYHVMFDPDVYPLNWAFLDGRAPVPPEVREPSDATGPTRTASLADGGQGTAG